MILAKMTFPSLAQYSLLSLCGLRVFAVQIYLPSLWTVLSVKSQASALLCDLYASAVKSASPVLNEEPLLTRFVGDGDAFYLYFVAPRVYEFR